MQTTRATFAASTHPNRPIALKIMFRLGLLFNALILGMAYFFSMFMIQKAFTAYAIGGGHSGYAFGFALTLVIMIVGVMLNDYHQKKRLRRLNPQEHQPVYRIPEYRTKAKKQAMYARKKAHKNLMRYQAQDYSLGTGH